jgi:hypothetical protein
MAFDLSNLSNDQGVQLASIGANLVGTGLQYNASQNAAQQQKDAAAAAAKLQADTRGPWVAAGTQALGTLQTGLAPGGQFSKPFNMADATNTGAMQFAEQQGQEAIGNTAAAQGGLLGTNAQQAAVKFAEQNAAQFQNQAFNQFQTDRLTQLGAQQSLAGIGQTNLNAVADAGSNSLLAAGGAGAAGTVGGANILSQGLTTLGGGASTYNTLSKLLGPSGGTVSGGTGITMGGVNAGGTGVSSLGGGYTGANGVPVSSGFNPVNFGGSTGGAPAQLPAYQSPFGVVSGQAATGGNAAAASAGQAAGAEVLAAGGDAAAAAAAAESATAAFTANAAAASVADTGAYLAADAAASYAAADVAATAATVAAGEGFWATVASYATEIFAFASSFFSDEQMKKDINRVGATDAGVPIYTYQMKSGGPTQMGVMAQELERVKPDAVRMHPSGYRMVDYGKVS